MGFGKLLELKLKEKNIKQAELADKTGIPKTTLSSMISRDISKVEIENFLKICNALNCNPEEFYKECSKGAEKPLPPSFIKKYNVLDMYGQKAVNYILDVEYDRCTYVEEEQEEPTITISHSTYKASAGTGFELGEGDSWEKIDVPDTAETRKADFAITIKGNSMEPVYYDGDIVLVKAQDAVDVGEVGIFTVNGAGYIKRYGGDRLISLNAEYDDILFNDNDEIHCKGKVIGRI